MTDIEVAQLVHSKHTAHLFRPKKNVPGQYDAKSWLDDGNKKGWIMLDGWTASAIVAVYNKLNDTNKAKFASYPIESMATIAFKIIGKER